MLTAKPYACHLNILHVQLHIIFTNTFLIHRYCWMRLNYIIEYAIKTLQFKEPTIGGKCKIYKVNHAVSLICMMGNRVNEIFMKMIQ